ncbi:MAG: nickel pincer cofactor biosynthesis protein LarC [Verrucomicrobia bacterium]|nr:nickel pincer cofactor biosynthesis protein LarC [Verrucomicrobiota bacterium]
MRTLYLDIFSGISGDMFIGAMIDLGVDVRLLEDELRKLDLSGYHLHVGKGERGAIAGSKFDVHIEGDPENAAHAHSHESHATHEHGHGHHHHGHGHGHEHAHADDHDHEHVHGRTHAEIRKLIQTSQLSPWVKEKSLAVFQRIATAEGKIHDKPASDVHFHEVGAVDSIVDVVGACVALEMLGQPRVKAGRVTEGTGFIRCAHGRFPLPAPATMEILGARGIQIDQTDEPAELVTPTGAAILAEFAESFGPIAGLRPERIGYGLGGRENKTRPNVLRAILGTAEADAAHDWERDEVVMLETNIDDLSPEVLGHVLQRAMLMGALDCYHTPIQMKKDRPGVLLSVLCTATDADRFTAMLLTETTAFGVRRSTWERRKLRREIRGVLTPYGEIQVKLGWLDGRCVQTAPEFESCRLAAEKHSTTLRVVYEAAVRAAH